LDTGRSERGQTNTWIRQKSYDEFKYKAVFVAPGSVVAKLGRNMLRPYIRVVGGKGKEDGHGPSELRVNMPCPYKRRIVREGAWIRSGRGRIRVGRF
jgi:hypothetical protein